MKNHADQRLRGSFLQTNLVATTPSIGKPQKSIGMSDKPYSFKTLLILYTCAYLPFSLLSGVLVLLEEAPIYMNEKPITGWKGLVISIAYIPLFGLIMAFVNWLMLRLGLLVHSFVRRIAGKQKMVVADREAVDVEKKEHRADRKENQ
jgi:hypothetical protein